MAFDLKFPHSPTEDQAYAIEALSIFLDGNGSHRIFILRGYAGTGKTTLIAALAKALREAGIPCILLAPTGRAAKVLSKHAEQQAWTIHRHIYELIEPPDGPPYFVLTSRWPPENAVFVIDEASMIRLHRDDDEMEMWHGEGLLPDLLTYVFREKGTRIIFVGDMAQLPPVGEMASAALSTEILASEFGLDAEVMDLRQVTRQASKSGPLLNATYIRHLIETRTWDDRLVINLRTSDIDFIRRLNLTEAVSMAYQAAGIDNVCIVVRDNRTAVEYNYEIRRTILGYEEELSVGDRLMIVRNNYHTMWTWEDIPFLANGEMVTVVEISSPEERLEEFRFCDLAIEVENLSGEKVILRGKVILNTLTSHSPSLPIEDAQELRSLRRSAYLNLSRGALSKALRDDPYLNALQVKHGYAITCHKAQGGQWTHVFVHRGWWHSREDRIDAYRWFYTAITRTTNRLTHISYPPHLIRRGIQISELLKQYTPS